LQILPLGKLLQKLLSIFAEELFAFLLRIDLAAGANSKLDKTRGELSHDPAAPPAVTGRRPPSTQHDREYPKNETRPRFTSIRK
jgi:hypothetical protein